MRKWVKYILLTVFVLALTGCGSQDKIAGRSYCYEKEGLCGEPFSITIQKDGKYSYYEGPISSYLGYGSWTLEDDILVLTDETGYPFVNRFRVEGEDLIFISEGSTNFMLINVEDGERFTAEKTAGGMDMIKAAVIVILLILAVLAVISCFMAAYVAKPRYTSLEKAKEIAEDAGFWRDYDKLEKEETEIESYDGYRLKAFYVPAPVNSDKYVVISHGYTYNRYGSLRYLHMFRSFGYNCLIYDNRGHGANPRTKCTMGVRESKDLLRVIDWMYERFGENITLGLHGESMGSALQIMALKEKPKVKFVVNDCGYADLMGVLKNNVGTLHMPKCFCYLASAACRVVFGYAFTKVRPIDSLAENTVPVCFIHGAADDFIPCDHSERMHRAMSAYSELHLFPGADHGHSIDSDEESYYRIVKEFLNKVL